MAKNTETKLETKETHSKKEPLPIEMPSEMKAMDYVVLGGILAFLLLNLVLIVSLFVPK